MALACAAFAAGLLSGSTPPPQVAVNAKTYNGYSRTRLSDGSLKPETYTVAEGGCWNNSGASSVEATSFSRIVQIMAGVLETKNYLPARGSTDADLMIVVFWGSTQGAEDGQYRNELVAASGAQSNTASPPPPQGPSNVPRVRGTSSELSSALAMNQLENEERIENDSRNAHILGYYDDFAKGMSELGNGTWRGRDAVTEVEANRYFIVLKAYDSHFASRDKKLKLLWEARFSIYQRGYDFGEQLPTMLEMAGRFFGRDSDGLVRADPPEGSVKVGPAVVVPPDASAQRGH